MRISLTYVPCKQLTKLVENAVLASANLKNTFLFSVKEDFSSKKGRDAEQMIEKFKCVSVCVLPSTQPVPNWENFREFTDSKRQVVS